MSDAGIDPPKAPQPPAPPIPHYVSVYGTGDPRALVRQFVTDLKKKKTIDLSIFPSAHLRAMEATILQELTNDEISKYGYTVRRILRFWMAAEAKLTQGAGGKVFTIKHAGTGGDSVNIPSLKLGALAASVTARTKVTTSSGFARDEGEAYTLSFSGPTAGISWLQFVWRQIIAVRPSAKGDAKRLQMRINHQGRAYLLTTDEKRPRWTTDGSSKLSAFYESDTTVIRSGTTLTMSDEPSPMTSHVGHLFDLPDPPTRIRSKFRAAAYLVKNMDVLYRADIALDWDIEQKSGKPVATLVDAKAKGRLTDKLDAEHRAALALQFPQFDYFPGDLIGPPVPADTFEAISISDPRLATWPSGQVWEKRYEAAALIARANLIEDVIDDPKLTIAGGTTVDRGLNYSSSLSAQGQTGYIGADGKYSNPDLPISRYAPLPKVASLLGPSTFDWSTKTGGVTTKHEREKEYTIATIRHEMAHARHNQMAIGWLIKWRDELTKDSFETWLEAEHKLNRIGKVDFHIVRASLKKGTAPTEIFAWLEGFFAALPFLPSSPKLDKLAAKELWPTAISELDGSLKHLNLLIDKSQFDTEIKKKAGSAICGGLNKDQRATLVLWIDVLIDPDALSPLTDEQKGWIRNLQAESSKNHALLKELKKIAKTCPS